MRASGKKTWIKSVEQETEERRGLFMGADYTRFDPLGPGRIS
jgi:hypothetical protein